MDMEAFLFEDNVALVPRPIAGLIQELQRFPNFEKVLCYQYSGIFNSPTTRVQPGGTPTVVLYRDYQDYLQRARLAQPVCRRTTNKWFVWNGWGARFERCGTQLTAEDSTDTKSSTVLREPIL
jgi:hypothetical protein